MLGNVYINYITIIFFYYSNVVELYYNMLTLLDILMSQIVIKIQLVYNNNKLTLFHNEYIISCYYTMLIIQPTTIKVVQSSQDAAFEAKDKPAQPDILSDSTVDNVDLRPQATRPYPGPCAYGLWLAEK